MGSLGPAGEALLTIDTGLIITYPSQLLSFAVGSNATSSASVVLFGADQPGGGGTKGDIYAGALKVGQGISGGTITTVDTETLTVDPSGAATLDLGTGNNAKTINIGTGTAGNTLNILTNNTTKDTLTIGSALDDVAITSDSWSITNAGALTVSSCVGCGVDTVTPVVYTSNNTWTKSNYTGLKFAYVIVTGSGGGGGGADSTDGSSAGGGGGGGAGGTSIETFDDSELTATESITVGTAGTAGTDAGGTGGNGNQSIFGTDSDVTANGGNGGTGVSTGSDYSKSAGGSGGTATATGDVNIAGGDGEFGTGENGPRARGGIGGGSYWGGGGDAGRTIAAGSVAGIGGNAYGSGGGGAANGDNTTGAAGGAGAGGVVVVFNYTSTGGDLAEWYQTDGNVLPGDIVSVSAQSVEYASVGTGLQKTAIMEKATVATTAIGVVSTMPFSAMGGDILPAGSYPKPIALAGRVPVNVTESNGKIKAGDKLALSDVPGVAMRATKAGETIGKALHDSNCQEKKECKVLMLVNMSYSTGMLMKQALLEDGIDIGAIPSGLDVSKVMLSHMLKNEVDIRREDATSEILTDRVMAGLEVITPQLVASGVAVDTLEPVNADLVVRLGSDGSIQVVNKESSVSASPVITFDAYGNAQFAGTVKAGKFELLDNPIVKNIASSSSQINSIDVESILERVKNILLRSPLEFFGRIFFASRVTFNADTAGSAVIPSWGNSVRIQFAEPYDKAPVVTLSLVIPESSQSAFLSDGVKAAVSDVTPAGFTILLDTPAPRDLMFNWIAIDVKDKVTSWGESVLPAVSPVPSTPTPVPTLKPTETPVSSPSATPDPQLN